ncbi:MAG: peptidoglycan-binding domain-containing protein [Pseudomonadota bacterium]
MNFALIKSRMALLAAMACAAIASASEAQAQAQRICIEEVSGVCLKYATREAGDATKPKASAALSPAARNERGLRLSREDRKAAQRGLAAGAFYGGSIDGAFGPQSRRAIAAWQRANGFTASGYLAEGQVALLSDAGRADGESGAGEVFTQSIEVDKESTMTVTVTRLSATEAELKLTISSMARNGPNYPFENSCRIPLDAAFSCRLRDELGRSRNRTPSMSGSWSRREVSGQLPKVSVFSTGSASFGTTSFKMW